MGRLAGVRCEKCRVVKIEEGSWSAVWRLLKKEGWTVDRGVYRCPGCSIEWRAQLDKDASDRGALLEGGKNSSRDNSMY